MKKNIFLLILISLIFTSCTAATQAKPAGDRTETISAPQTERVTRKPDPTETTVKPETTFVITAPGTLMTDSVSTDFETAPATEDFSSETEVLTTEPLETSEQDAYETVIPDQSYIGEWLSYPFPARSRLSISSIDTGSVSFVFTVHKGPMVKATAIEEDGKYFFGEDISPDLEYSFYDAQFYKTCKVSGYLIFEKDSVTLKFDNTVERFDGLNGVIRSESMQTLEVAVNDNIAVLTENGWENIKQYQFDLSSDSKWGRFSKYDWSDNVIPYGTEDALVYSVLGTSGDMTAVIRVVYERETAEWSVADTYYVSGNGTVLQGEVLDKFMTEKGKTDLILSADDADLIDYLRYVDKYTENIKAYDR